MLRAITYARVSTTDQADSGLGLDAQHTALTAALSGRGWELVSAFVDEGRSGGNMNRPALTAALTRLDRGDADVLVVSKLDRLSRSVGDFAGICARAKRRGWSVVALDVGVDTTSPSGKLIANVMSSVAEWEREVIGVRTAEALAALKARGVRLGGPVELPEPIRRRIAAERAAGDSLRTIGARLTAEGVPTARGGQWHPATVRAVVASVALDDHAAAASAA
jgi:DNA invertase Pin-like site-specific DNA recombinase